MWALPTQFTKTGSGGGTAVVFKKHFTSIPLSLGSFNSSEISAFKIVHKDPICCIIICCPPNSNSSSGFLTEFSDQLSPLVLKFDKAIIIGDFNIHIEISNPFARLFKHL